MQEELRNIVVVDPRQSSVYSSENSTYLLEKPCQTVSYNSFTAQTANPSQISFQVQVPSKSVGVDRKMFIELEADISVSAIRNNTQPLFVPGAITYNSVGENRILYLDNDNLTFYMRSNPLHRVSDNSSLYINGLNINEQSSDYSGILDNVSFYGKEYECFSSFGHGDSFQAQYGDSGSNGINGNLDSNSQGSNKNSFFNNNNSDQVQYIITSNPIATQNDQLLTGNVRVKWIEQVCVGPFNQRMIKKDNAALFGINQIQLTYNTSAWERAICVNVGGGIELSNAAGAAAFYNFSFSAVRSAILRCAFLTPTSIMGPIPPSLFYSCPLFTNYPQTPVVLLRNAPQTVTANNIQLPSVPKYLIIFASKVCTNTLPFQADALYYNTQQTILTTCAEIRNLNINFNNSVGLLSSCSSHDLYHISARNKVNMTWQQWSKHIGSVVVIDLAKDLGLDALTAVASSGSYNLSVQATINDLSDELNSALNPTYSYRLNVLTMEDGLLNITPSSTRLTSSYDLSIVLRAIASGDVSVNAEFGDASAVVGSSWWSDLGWYAKNMVIRPTLDKISAALPRAEAAYNTSFIKKLNPYDKEVQKGFTAANWLVSMANKLLGEGMSGGQIKKIMKDQLKPEEMMQLKEYLKMHKSQGQGLVGGKQISKKRLAPKKY